MLEVLVCECKRRCVHGSCYCADARLKCADTCPLTDFDNAVIDGGADSDIDNSKRNMYMVIMIVIHSCI